MGLLALKRFMSAQRDRRRQRIQAHDGSPASVSKRKSSPFQEDRDYEGGKRMKYLGPILPEVCDHMLIMKDLYPSKLQMLITKDLYCKQMIIIIALSTQISSSAQAK